MRVSRTLKGDRVCSECVLEPRHMNAKISHLEEGQIVAARTTVDGVEYAVVAVGPEVLDDRIRLAQVLRHFADRLYGGLPVILNARDESGRERFVGGGTAPGLLEESPPHLEWQTLYEDGGT